MARPVPRQRVQNEPTAGPCDKGASDFLLKRGKWVRVKNPPAHSRLVHSGRWCVGKRLARDCPFLVTFLGKQKSNERKTMYHELSWEYYYSIGIISYPHTLPTIEASHRNCINKLGDLARYRIELICFFSSSFLVLISDPVFGKAAMENNSA